MPTKKKNRTIYDIAKEARVSPATVSRILNGTARVRKEKSDMVNGLIQKYNFRPNAMARALSETRSMLIGMLSADSSNPYYNSVFTECEQAALKCGYSLVLLNSFSNADAERNALYKLQQQRVDAIVICGGRIDLAEPDPAFMRILDELLKTVPLIVGSKVNHEKIYSVAIDHERSMDVAFRHLTGMGHHDIAFVYAGSEFYGTREKIARFRALMQEENLSVHDEWLMDVGHYDSLSGRAGAQRILGLKKKPTAVIGINDMVTVGILKELIAQNTRVPEDISLISFDDTFVTSITSPELTAVGCDYAGYSAAIMDAVLAAIQGEKPPYVHLMEPILTKRKSCCPPVCEG